MVDILSRSEREQWSIDLAALRSALQRGRAAAVVTALCVGLAGLVVMLLLPRKYDAEAILVASDATASAAGPLSSLGSLASLAATVGISAPRSESLSEALALLTSQSFIGAFIEEMSLKPLMFPSDWDAGTGQWKNGLLWSPPTDFDAYDHFVSDILRVDEDASAGIVSVRVTWKDPTEAAMWANALVDRLNAAMRRRAIENADNTLLFLEKELEATQLVSVQEAIYRLMEGQLNLRAVARAREDYVLRYVDRARAKDPKNYDHPKIWILSFLVLFMAGVSGIGAGVFWGVRRRSANESPSAQSGS